MTITEQSKRILAALDAWVENNSGRAFIASDALHCVEELRGKFGEIGDQRLTVTAALTACDELLDANARLEKLEQELASLRDVRVAAGDRARATQVAVANALNAAAERIEKTTQVLNRTVGGGVAIG